MENLDHPDFKDLLENQELLEERDPRVTVVSSVFRDFQVQLDLPETRDHLDLLEQMANLELQDLEDLQALMVLWVLLVSWELQDHVVPLEKRASEVFLENWVHPVLQDLLENPLAMTLQPYLPCSDKEPVRDLIHLRRMSQPECLPQIYPTKNARKW